MAGDSEITPEASHKLRYFTRVLMSYVDFQQAEGIARYILAQNFHDRYPEDRFALQGLNCGMIVAYCRPFSGNDNSEEGIPDLPRRILRVLSVHEREIHDVVVEDRNTVLAHSDSSAWEPSPQIHRVKDHDILVPMFNYVHAPLTKAVTEEFAVMCETLREACFDERLRLETELRPFLPVVQV